MEKLIENFFFTVSQFSIKNNHYKSLFHIFCSEENLENQNHTNFLITILPKDENKFFKLKIQIQKKCIHVGRILGKKFKKGFSFNVRQIRFFPFQESFFFW